LGETRRALDGSPGRGAGDSGRDRTYFAEGDEYFALAHASCGDWPGTDDAWRSYHSFWFERGEAGECAVYSVFALAFHCAWLLCVRTDRINDSRVQKELM
jgi:hypothetical protein